MVADYYVVRNGRINLNKTNKVTVRPAKTQISQFDQSLRCALNGQLRTQAFFMRIATTLIRLGECPGWSESSLCAQSPCWFYHVAAHFYSNVYFNWQGFRGKKCVFFLWHLGRMIVCGHLQVTLDLSDDCFWTVGIIYDTIYFFLSFMLESNLY